MKNIELINTECLHVGFEQPINKLLQICKIMYPGLKSEIYDEPWSSDEFIAFSLDNRYLNKVHKYQLIDVIKNDLLNNSYDSLLKSLDVTIKES